MARRAIAPALPASGGEQKKPESNPAAADTMLLAGDGRDPDDDADVQSRLDYLEGMVDDISFDIANKSITLKARVVRQWSVEMAMELAKVTPVAPRAQEIIEAATMFADYVLGVAPDLAEPAADTVEAGDGDA